MDTKSLTVGEMREILRINKNLAYRLIARGPIASIRLGGVLESARKIWLHLLRKQIETECRRNSQPSYQCKLAREGPY